MLNLQIRLIDICISLTLLILLFPIMLIISFLILIFDGRPVIYKQSRVGFKGKIFVIYKFRTMKQVVYKNEELRLTYLGKILRKTSFDELPQLLNVLFREMSMVGPRPLPKEVENKIKNSTKTKRRKVLPGITGLAQINLFENKNKWKKQLIYDAQYVKKQSFFTDLKIISLTFLIIFKTKQDYRNEKPLSYNN